MSVKEEKMKRGRVRQKERERERERNDSIILRNCLKILPNRYLDSRKIRSTGDCIGEREPNNWNCLLAFAPWNIAAAEEFQGAAMVQRYVASDK